MAVLEGNRKRVALARGTTWGTAVAATTVLDGDFTWTATQGLSRGIDVNNKHLAHLRRTDFSAEVTITGMMTFNRGFGDLVYALMRHEAPGTGTAPVEQTPTEGDYKHTMVMANPAIPFYTVAMDNTSSTVIEFPSVQWQSMTWSQNVNEAAEVSFTGVADRFVKSGAVNTNAILDAITPPDYEEPCLGGINHYFRLGDTTDALAAGDNKLITNYTINLQRNETPTRSTRGANSPYINQPSETGRVTGTLAVTFVDEETQDGEDIIQEFLDQTVESSDNYMAEIFMDGSQIGAGVNQSIKWQFPFLGFSAERPTGHNRQEDTLQEVTITFEIMSADSLASTPAGMNGNTASIEIINNKSTGYST